MRGGYYIEDDGYTYCFRTLRLVRLHVSLHTTCSGNPYLNSAVRRWDDDTFVGFIRILPNGHVRISRKIC